MRDGFVGALWFAINLGWFGLLWAVCLRLFPRDARWQRLCQTIVLFWSWCVLTCVALGLLRALTGGTLIAVNLVGLIVGWAWLRKSSVQEYSPHSATPERTDRLWQDMMWLGVLAIFGALAVQFSLLGFPAHWDALMYHIPLVDEWLQSRTLYGPGCPVWYNPGNFELIGLWFVAPLTGDFWVALSGTVPVCLLGLSTLEMGSELGLPRWLRVATVLAVLGTEMVFRQTISMGNDIAVTATFATAVAYGLRWIRERSPGSLLISSCAFGLLTGIKYYAVGYAVVAAAVLLIACMAVGGFRRTLTWATSALLAATLLGGYWYARNAILTGTPVYPLGFSEQTNELASLRPGSFGSTLLGNGDPTLLLLYVDAVRSSGGFIQYLGVLLLPLLVGWALMSGLSASRTEGPGVVGFGHDREGLSVADRRTLSEKRTSAVVQRSSNVVPAVVLVALLVGTFFIFSITPFVVNPDDNRQLARAWRVVRFSQCPLWASVLGCSLLANDLSRLVANRGSSLRRFGWGLLQIPAFLLLGGALLQFGAATWFSYQKYLGSTWEDLATGGVIAIDLVFIAVIVGKAASVRTGTRVWQTATVVLLAALAGGLTTFNSNRWHREFAPHYDRQFRTTTFCELERMQPPPRLIGTMVYRNYPFHGSRRQFRVARPLKITSRDAFQEFLRTFAVDVLCVMHADPFRFGRYHDTNEWAADMPGILTRLRQEASFDVYRVDRDRLARVDNGPVQE